MNDDGARQPLQRSGAAVASQGTSSELKLGNCYKATFGKGYFFGRLDGIDLEKRVYSLYDLRKKYTIVAPMDNTLLEPYEELSP